jgi:hypothetical protein
MKNRTIVLTAILALLAFTFMQCSSDDVEKEAETGQVSFKITDSPSDDANISGTFITVSDIKVDGKSVEGFAKQSFEISALQNGNTRTLFAGHLKADSYSKITLVLDMAADASGNAPGCYVLDTSGKKHSLAASSESTMEIDLQKEMQVSAASQNNIVFDFDLRKAVVRQTDTSTGSNYSFVAKADMNTAVRVAAENKTGSLKGKVNNTLFTGKKVVVYAYRKGTFSTATELSAVLSGKAMFGKAVTSASVAQDGNYHLAFLEEGEYEVYLASYGADSSGKMQFHGLLTATSLTAETLLDKIALSANATVTVNINVTGILL